MVAALKPYIDGFVLPVQTKHLEKYQAVAEKIAKIWIEHGALDYSEYVSDDLTMTDIRSFASAADAKEDESIVFGWVVFKSRESRNEVNKRVAGDPRMADLIEPLTRPPRPIFDPTRMAYGGFRSLIQTLKLKE